MTLTLPAVLTPNFDSIPTQLRELPQWVTWRLEPRPGEDKPTKIPYNPRTGGKAQASNPDTWSTFADACAAYDASLKDAQPYSGVGLQLGTDGGPYFAVDLDKCIDPETGEIADWAQEIVAALPTYWEKSPSGHGLRALGRGHLPEGGRNRSGPVELYDRLRYVTVTGQPFGAAQPVTDCAAVLPALHARLFPAPSKPPQVARPVASLSLSDAELIDKATNAGNGAKFAALWRGDTSGFNGDDSAADLALCSLLAFWTQGEAARIDSLFRQSGLCREKWERHDYSERTIKRALEGTTEYYTNTGIVIRAPKTGTRTRTDRSDPVAKPDDGWDVPVPFGTNNLPCFPLEALPPVLANYVSEVAETTQVPIDMAGMMGLAVVAAAGARRARVQIGDTHAEGLNLYIAAVMEPGSRKSSTLEAFAFPLREAEQYLTSERLPEHLAAKEKLEHDTRRLAYLRDQAVKGKDTDEQSVAKDEALHLAANMTEVPSLPRLLADDITVEKLGALLSEQDDNCIGILSAEGGIFGILGGRYNQGAVNLDLILKGHSGEAHRVDRVNQPPRHIPCPTITMGLAVQPDVLTSLADNSAFRGRGLLGRFLYTLPENLVGTRAYQNRAIDRNAKKSYQAAILKILNMPSVATKDDPGQRHILQLRGEALNYWKLFHDQVEARQADGGDLAGIRDWASKLAGAVARIAGNLHLLEYCELQKPWASPISEETIAAAWAIGEYLIPHGQAAFNQIGADAAHALARRILRWIDRDKPDIFTVRDCFRVHQTSSTMEEMTAALTILSDHGHIRLEEQTRSGPGRAPSPKYAVNPHLRNK